jgi:hypothetical protein
LEYSSSRAGWKFTELSPFRAPILLRNAVFHEGQVFDILSVAPYALGDSSSICALCVSRNVAILEENSLLSCYRLEIVVFESGSRLRDIRPWAFGECPSLRSIAIPSFVGVLETDCFAACRSLQSMMFEPPCKLAAIETSALLLCESLRWLCLPASVTAIADDPFSGSAIRSIDIEDGSVSFRVLNGLLVDSEVRSLVWVIGSPESIVIPSSIEELRPYCYAENLRLATVEFESDSQL